MALTNIARARGQASEKTARFLKYYFRQAFSFGFQAFKTYNEEDPLQRAIYLFYATGNGTGI
jgi:hypothetical protein